MSVLNNGNPLSFEQILKLPKEAKDSMKNHIGSRIRAYTAVSSVNDNILTYTNNVTGRSLRGAWEALDVEKLDALLIYIAQ